MFERVNSVTEGTNAYKAVNDIFRGDREEQRAIAETEYNRNRQARLDDMSAESHKAALESNALAQETSRLQLKKEKDAAEENKWQAIKLMALRNPQGWYNDLDPSDSERIIAETKSDPKFAFLHTPEARRTQLAKIQQIYAAMPNPDKPQFDMPSLLEGMNHVFASQLAKGTDDKGEPAKKEIVSFTMDPRDKSFIPELKITRKDGSSYTAPMTVDPLTGERSSAPDSIVKKITIPQIADYLGVAEGLINLADAKQVSLGDDEPLKAALAEIKGKKESKQLAGAVTAIDKAWDPTKSAKENTLTGLAAALETAPTPESAIKALEVVLKAKEEKETKLDWQDNVMGKDGKVYKVAYDSKGKEVKRERQYVKPEKGDSGDKPSKDGPTVRYIKASKVRRTDGTIGPGTMAFRMNDPNSKAMFEQWIKTGQGQEVWPDQETTKDIVTGDTTRTKVAPNSGTAAVSRTGEPDLATAKQYIAQYGSKEAAMAAWKRGE